MTVNTTNITSGPYSGNGIADSFAYTFRIEDESQVLVYETNDLGVQTALTLDVDYTVAGTGVDGGGTITRVSGALPLGYSWYIRADYKQTQTIDFDSQGSFFPDTHERAFDKLTYLIQQVTESINRTLKFSDSYAGSASLSLPNPSPLKYFRWNALANALELVDGTTAIVTSDISFDPSGTNLGSTNVQDAIAENNQQISEIVSGATELLSGLDATDELLLNDAGTLKRVDLAVFAELFLRIDNAIEKAVQGNVYIPEQVLTDDTTIVWDVSLGAEAMVTLAGNRTLSVVAVPPAGSWVTLRVYHTNRVLSFSSDFAFGDAGVPTLSTGTNKTDILTFRSNGSKLIFIGVALGA